MGKTLIICVIFYMILLGATFNGLLSTASDLNNHVASSKSQPIVWPADNPPKACMFSFLFQSATISLSPTVIFNCLAHLLPSMVIEFNIAREDSLTYVCF